MTEQADQKARVEALDTVFCDDGGMWVRDPRGNCRPFDFNDYEALLSRITDLEAERDEAVGAQFTTHPENGVSVGWDEMAAAYRSRATYAESRLALAEKVMEAGRGVRLVLRLAALKYDFDLTNSAAMDEFDAALTAYEENTSSNDLTTGEDDA